MNKITIGADPEVFMKNSDGNCRSAHGVIPGTKEKPHPVPGGAIQVDGMALEFNIDPANSEEEFVSRVEKVMDHLEDSLPENFSIIIRPTVQFGIDYFKAQPEKAKELGCEPDYNAYTGEMNKINDNVPATLRTAAGHVHIGIDKKLTPLEERKLAILCDVFIGLFMNSIGDGGCIRKRLYGKAGAYRPKPYGIEYRTPSNRWLSTKEHMRNVYSGAVMAAEALPYFTEIMKFIENEGGLGHYTELQYRVDSGQCTASNRMLLNSCKEYLEYVR